MERVKTNNVAVDNATIEELIEFFDSWEGKLTIPPEWIQKNLRDARKVLIDFAFSPMMGNDENDS